MLSCKKNTKRGLLFIISLLAVASMTMITALEVDDARVTKQTAPSTCETVPNIEIAFSPRQGANKLIIKNIQTAKTTIKVAAYSFTSKPIAQALIDAHRRGVAISVVLDKSQARDQHSAFKLFQKSGIKTKINNRYAIMHNKFMIIDDQTMQTGSFNYSRSAEEKNAENVLVIHNDPIVISQYAEQWKKLWDEAVEYTLH